VPDFRRNGDHAHGSMTTKTPHFIGTDMHTKFRSFFSPEISYFFYGPALPNSLRILRRETVAEVTNAPSQHSFSCKASSNAQEPATTSRNAGQTAERDDARTDGRTDGQLVFYLTQPPALSDPTTQIPEESNLHGQDWRRTDGRAEGPYPFSLTLHNLRIFPIQRPRFPKSLTCTAEIDDVRTGERTDGSLFLLPYTLFQSFQFNDPDSRRL
jgi:hypothetical protein